jgi:hypothetical protein
MKKNIKKSERPAPTAENENESGNEFPGYPAYPASEDIMNRGKRIDVDIEEAIEVVHPNKGVMQAHVDDNKSTLIKGKSNLTKDDFQALASDEIESTGDDEILQNRTYPVDFAGQDLDIPGTEDDDAQEEIGSEDEENNSYSIGGDGHSALEEDRS